MSRACNINIESVSATPALAILQIVQLETLIISINNKILDCDRFSVHLICHLIGARSRGCPVLTFCNWIPEI